MILFISIGIVCASQNNESNNIICENNDSLPIDDAINNYDDNGTVQLEKKYYLEENRTLKLNKSITFNGAENRTVIEGNNNCLNLDVVEDAKTFENPEKIIFIFTNDGLKKTGKHLIFNNITFKNIRLQTWHKMEFNNCEFINSTFTSQELDNRFYDCIFNNSKIELVVIVGYFNETPRVFSEFLNCRFFESELKTEIKYAPIYIHIVGGDFFRVYDRVDLSNCNFTKSKVSLNNIYLNIDDSIFNKTDLIGHSNTVNINKSQFLSQNIDFTICKTNFTYSILNDSNIDLKASYFSIGSLTNLNNCNINNSNIKISVGFRSLQSQISMIGSNIYNTYLDTTDAFVIIEKSELNKIEMLLCFSGLKITDSTISNNASAQNTIKTKLQDTREVWNGEKYINKTFQYQIKTNYTISNTSFINESGKYQLNSEEISKNTIYNFTYIRQEVYFQNNILIVILKDQNGNPVVGEKIYIDIKDRYEYDTPSITTDENGTAKYCLSESGIFKILAYYYSPGVNYDMRIHSISLNISVKPPVDELKVSKYNFKENLYSTIKSYLKFKLTSKNGKNLSNIKLTIKLTSKNKNKKYTLYTDKNGKIKFKIPEKLDAGKYKLKISIPYTKITKTISFKISKAKATVKAPKVTRKFKKSTYFKVSIKNKISKKAVSKVKVKIKVYTGKKYKTYTVKTNKKGTVKINTKNLKIGKHKVIISSGSKNYKISAKSEIKIKK